MSRILHHRHFIAIEVKNPYGGEGYTYQEQEEDYIKKTLDEKLIQNRVRSRFTSLNSVLGIGKYFFSKAPLNEVKKGCLM